MAHKTESTASEACDGLEATCWICLSDAEDIDSGALIEPCLCPRLAHQRCLARWQLQNAGKPEEAYCRFCEMQLPDWTSAYERLPRGEPLMTISHNGRIFMLTARSGEEGREEFIAKVRAIFGLGEGEDLELSFGCKVPGSPGEEINLEGWDCYDAAVHCASICAGQRTSKALNLDNPDVLRQPAHAVLSTPTTSSSEPFTPVNNPEGASQGCWNLLIETAISFWDNCRTVLQEMGKRMADEAQPLSRHGPELAVP